MAIQTGDILYSPSTTGHIMMAYDSSTIIHAQMKGDFHKDPDQSMEGGSLNYISDGRTTQIFRPPWNTLADLIAGSATYGAYRAVRLLIGDSSYGPKAHARLQKYRDRLLAAAAAPITRQNPLVATVTCSEAVILCYQLAFPLNEAPFFIRLDAAHAMPSTLAT